MKTTKCTEVPMTERGMLSTHLVVMSFNRANAVELGRRLLELDGQGDPLDYIELIADEWNESVAVLDPAPQRSRP
jgi:hypothetical protein